MKIAVIGTGMVGQVIAGKLAELGHDVFLGTRDVQRTLAKSEPNYASWAKEFPSLNLVSYDKAAASAELVFNATNGSGTLAALMAAGEANLAGKILIDIANPLDFSKGMPPSLAICNTDSLGEQVQRQFPQAKVVKTLNTVNANLMVNPRLLAGGDHSMFICGNDAPAKAEVTRILTEWFGWKDVFDLGDISNARGTEMLLPIWLRTYAALQSPMFSFKLVR